MTAAIDFNLDLGEAAGVRDPLKVASSTNVACGFYAAAPGRLDRTARFAERKRHMQKGKECRN